MSKAEKRFKEAFDRLKANKPKVLKVGTPVTQNNVAREAGVDPSALKKSRHPSLVLEIQDYIANLEIDLDTEDKKKKVRTKRPIKDRLKDCQKQRDKLASICEAQANLIEQLREELRDLQNGIRKPSEI